MIITAKVIADSVSEEGKRITTLELCYPRFIHSEFMTHRVFSRNASSSRAIPVSVMLSRIWNCPAMPIHWGQNEKGMQAKAELPKWKRKLAQALWKTAGRTACVFAWGATKLGLHKQVANRITEPWQHISVIVTATEWENFFELRDHEDAQPEIQKLAIEIRRAMIGSVPKLLKSGEWHLPYITPDDRLAAFDKTFGYDWAILCKISAARCCRVSYLKHDGTKASLCEELNLCDRLAASRPIHASPFEHQATPDSLGVDAFGVKQYEWLRPSQHGNLVGWIQNRKLLELNFR